MNLIKQIAGREGECEDSDLSSVGRALDCRVYRYRAVPGSIPGGRMLFLIYYQNITQVQPPFFYSQPPTYRHYLLLPVLEQHLLLQLAV